MSPAMSLITCRACVFWKSFGSTAPLNGTCHRHAPAPGQHVDDTSYWPETSAGDACAEGIAAAQNPERAAIIACLGCVFWFRRDGQQGLVPERRSDLPRIWWRDAAFCARNAPAPASSVTRARWRATHASDGCGDGRAAI